MKYIRTKDGIYKQTDIVRLARAIVENCYPENYDYENIKQADTIEELCDEFIETYEIFDKKLFDKEVNGVIFIDFSFTILNSHTLVGNSNI